MEGASRAGAPHSSHLHAHVHVCAGGWQLWRKHPELELLTRPPIVAAAAAHGRSAHQVPYASTCPHACACAYACTHACACACTRAYARTHACACACTCALTYIRPLHPPGLNTSIYMRTHICICAYACMRTCLCICIDIHAAAPPTRSQYDGRWSR